MWSILIIFGVLRKKPRNPELVSCTDKERESVCLYKGKYSVEHKM